jgi:hypothetical protein
LNVDLFNPALANPYLGVGEDAKAARFDGAAQLRVRPNVSDRLPALRATSFF